MIKVIDYDPSITRCDPPKKIRYDRTDFIADTEADISAMNSNNSEYLNYPAGSSVLCLGNGKWYLLNAECNEYLEFKEGGSARTKANLYRSMVSDNGEILVTLDDEVISDGMNVLSIGDTVIVTVTADTGYSLTSLKVNGSDFTSGSTLTVSGDVVIEAVAEETPAPSSYTWNGTDVSEKDISSRESGTPFYHHHIADVTSITATDLLGATLVRTLNGIETSYVLTEEDIESQQVEGGTYTAVYVDETQGAVVIAAGLSSMGFADGIYFLRYDEEGKTRYGEYTSSLILAE